MVFSWVDVFCMFEPPPHSHVIGSLGVAISIKTLWYIHYPLRRNPWITDLQCAGKGNTLTLSSIFKALASCLAAADPKPLSLPSDCALIARGPASKGQGDRTSTAWPPHPLVPPALASALPVSHGLARVPGVGLGFSLLLAGLSFPSPFPCQSRC